MPKSSWVTPSIAQVRQRNADAIAGKLGLAVLPNGEVRVLADANAANAGLALEYVDWLANQLLPDTAEDRFLDKWATIYLVNADGSRGRKAATYASGTATVTATAITILPAGATFTAGAVAYQSTSQVTLGIGPNAVPLRALDAGALGNLAAGAAMSMTAAVVGVSGTAGVTVVSMTGGADEESDDELRVRVLDRIRLPPMGGDADDYVQWALSFPGVTRAWCSPNEMGVGTVTVRFMMDDLRATSDPLTNGFPLPQDAANLKAYLDTVRPVAMKDLFVAAPVPEPVNFTLANIDGYSATTRAAILASVAAMLKRRAAPAHALNGVRQAAQTIFASWVSTAVSDAAGVNSFDLAMTDHVMPSNGSMAVMGSITAALS